MLFLKGHTYLAREMQEIVLDSKTESSSLIIRLKVRGNMENIPQ
jgi:hypothetical protein